MFLGMACAVMWWLLAPSGIVYLFIYSILFGIFYGGYLSILPVLCMGYFGGLRLSSIIGALYTSWGFGGLLGPILVGFLFDQYGTYSQGLMICVVLVTLSAVSCLLMSEPSEDY